MTKDEQFSVLGRVIVYSDGEYTEKTTGSPVDNGESHASIMTNRQRARGAFGPTGQIL